VNCPAGLTPDALGLTIRRHLHEFHALITTALVHTAMSDGEHRAVDTFTPENCTRCPELCDERTQIVNGVGPISADILIVGEAPGEAEDTRGKPFIGRSGDVLTSVLRDSGIQRTDVRITNTVRCRPPDNRDPSREEQSNCQPYLYNEIQSVNPDVIVPVGRIPTTAFLDDPPPITACAGTEFTATINADDWVVVPSVHPAATLYNRDLEPVFKETFRTVAELTGRTPPEQRDITDFT